MYTCIYIHPIHQNRTYPSLIWSLPTPELVSSIIKASGQQALYPPILTIFDKDKHLNTIVYQ